MKNPRVNPAQTPTPESWRYLMSGEIEEYGSYITFSYFIKLIIYERNFDHKLKRKINMSIKIKFNICKL